VSVNMDPADIEMSMVKQVSVAQHSLEIISFTKMEIRTTLDMASSMSGEHSLDSLLG